eukprot:6225734-Amphidinium_carterae.1
MWRSSCSQSDPTSFASRRPLVMVGSSHTHMEPETNKSKTAVKCDRVLSESWLSLVLRASCLGVQDIAHVV